MGNNPLMAECAELVKGVTILAASKESECSVECNGHVFFTSLLIGALKGGASDLLDAESLFLVDYQQAQIFKLDFGI